MCIRDRGTAAALGSGENTLIGAAAGQATLVVTRVDMSGVTHRAEHALTVLEASEITLNLSQTEAELAAGETLLLTAETVPEGLRVTWASTNAEVLSVQDGLVQALQSLSLIHIFRPYDFRFQAHLPHLGSTYPARSLPDDMPFAKLYAACPFHTIDSTIPMAFCTFISSGKRLLGKRALFDK